MGELPQSVWSMKTFGWRAEVSGWVVRVGAVQSDVACQVSEDRGCAAVLVSGCFRGMGGLEGRSLWPCSRTFSSTCLDPLFSVSSVFSSTPSSPSRPWAPRETCPQKWSRLPGARCRACRAPSRKIENSSWPSFLAWSARSGPRSTPTTGLLPRTNPSAQLLLKRNPQIRIASHPNPTLLFHSLEILGGRTNNSPVKYRCPAQTRISLLCFNLH